MGCRAGRSAPTWSRAWMCSRRRRRAAPVPATVARKRKSAENEGGNHTWLTYHLSIVLEVDMRYLPGGIFTMGSDHFYPEERPRRKVRVDPFWIDETPVTNRQFAEFVAATGYCTFAER